jgi:hypothetical protein
MFKSLLTISFAYFICLAVSFGQNIKVNEPIALSEVMSEFQKRSMAEKEVDGWRIQIITTDDRRKMEAAKSKFETMYPEIFLKWEHIVPYYKIKIGAYKTKLDLQAFLQELREEFPSAFPIPDKVKKAELVDL